MHSERRLYAAAIVILMIVSLLAGLLAGCSKTETVTQTQTATQTRQVTQTVAGPTQMVTSTTGAGQTVTVTPAPATNTVTMTVSLPVTTITRTATPTATGAKQTIKLSLGAEHTTGVVWAKALDEFFASEAAKRVEARTNYKIEWNKAYGGSIAKVGEILEAVETGLLDLGLILPVFEPAKLPLQAWTFTNPFGSADPLLVSRAYVKINEMYPILYQYAEKNFNQKYLGGLLVTAPYGIGSKFPITKPEDVKGHKLMAAGPNLSWVEGVGAVPVQGSYAVAYSDIATGVYEGYVGDAIGNQGYKLYEVAPYWTDCGFGVMIGGWIAANQTAWSKIPKEVQDILIEVAREYPPVEAQMAVDLVNAAEKAIAAGGGKLSVLPFEQQSRWANMLPNIPNTKAKEIEAGGSGLPATQVYKAWNQLLKDEGFVAPRVWTFD